MQHKRYPQPLKRLKKDNRDFKLGQLFDLPKIEELPGEFILPAPGPKNQGGSDFCPAFTTCLLSEIQEGVRLEASWSFAASKSISGDIEEFGQDLRTAFKSHVKIGAVEESECPYNLSNKYPSFLRDISNYPSELIEKAKKHQKQSYFLIQGRYDAFDNIRAAIWLFRANRQGVGAGLLWGFPLDQAKLSYIDNNSGFGHAIPYIGWKKIDGEIYLIARNSYGKSVGDNGDFYVPRKVVNKFANIYGIFMMVDISPEEVKKELWGLLEKLKDILIKLLDTIQKQIKKPDPPAPPEPQPEPKPEPPKETMLDMVIRVAREENIGQKMFEQLVQVIECESKFNPKAINRNKNGTSDYGICQYNSYWYIGPGKPIPSIDIALNDPEFCVRTMCRLWKKGKQRDWICYRKLFP